MRRWSATIAARIHYAGRVAIAASLVAGCQGLQEGGLGIFFAGDSVEAPMVAVGGSAASGFAKFSRTSNGVSMQLSMGGLVSGATYRAVIHANGNCSSPNGFSAGPPWVPAGATERTMAQTGIAVTAGSLSVVMRIPGIPLDGDNSLVGKSIVLHSGAQGSLEARPDVPNNRVACGVIGLR